MKKGIILLSFLILFFLFLPGQIYADTLSSVSDTITTSRPSAATTLNNYQTANTSQVSTVDNGSLWLASDSALLKDPVNIGNSDSVSLASQSGVIGGSKTIYFYNTAGHYHGQGSPLIFPVTAMHTIQFTTVAAIPATGSIIITFPILIASIMYTNLAKELEQWHRNGLAHGLRPKGSWIYSVNTAEEYLPPQSRKIHGSTSIVFNIPYLIDVAVDELEDLCDDLCGERPGGLVQNYIKYWHNNSKEHSYCKKKSASFRLRSY